MLAIAICDDDAALCSLLKQMIAHCPAAQETVQRVALYKDGADLWQALQMEEHFDLIFLDVNMPGLDGITLGEKIRQTPELEDIAIAYISGDAGYAMALYDNYPLRFLTKDDKLTLENVCDVLARAEKMVQKNRRYLAFIKDRQPCQVPIDDIVYLESRRKQIVLHQTDGREESFYDKLDALEKTLKAQGFLRIHQSYLVNGDKIARITPTEVLLFDGEKLPISKAYRKSANEWLRSLNGGDRR